MLLEPRELKMAPRNVCYLYSFLKERQDDQPESWVFGDIIAKRKKAERVHTFTQMFANFTAGLILESRNWENCIWKTQRE